MKLDLTPEELLTTTRSVRKRLDLEKPVELDVIRECLQLAVQAPSGSNAQGWHFIVITDAEKKRAIGDLYRKGWRRYTRPTGGRQEDEAEPGHSTRERVYDSAAYLAEHMHEAPVLVIPCIEGRVARSADSSTVWQASLYGSILPASWSFMLAARLRGLGTCWTTLHLMYEEQAAEVLGIPYETVTQCALIPVAYTKGHKFLPAKRKPLDQVLHLESW